MDNAIAKPSGVSAGEAITPSAAADQGAQSKWKLLSYGSFAFPVSLAGLPILTYLPAFYAKELHLSAGLVGLVFLSARLWDGLADLMVGWFSDRSMSRFGRRKPWVIAGAPFLMVSTWFLCNPPPGAGLLYLALWAGLFYSTWAAVYIPYLSWGTELATDYTERSRVTAFREVFNMLGNMFFAVGPLVFLADNAPLRDVMFLIAVTVVVLVPLTALPLALFVRDPAPARRTEAHPLKELAALAKDRVLARFIFATICMLIANGVANSLAMFFFDVGLQMPNKLFPAIFVAYIATLCALPITVRLGKRVEKHRLLAGALAIGVVIYVVVTLLPAGNFPAAAAAFFVAGAVNAAVFVLPTSILADIIDHGEVMTGERRSGAYVAVYNLVVKIGLALGVGVSFGLLELVDFDPSATQYSATDVRNIRMLGFGLPALLTIPAVFLFLKFPITKKVHDELRERIAARQRVSE